MWKVRAGFRCIVNSFIFGSSFFGFYFLGPFLHEQITDIIIALRDTRSEVAEEYVILFIFKSAN